MEELGPRDVLRLAGRLLRGGALLLGLVHELAAQARVGRTPSGRSDLLTVKGGDKLSYAMRVAEFKKYMPSVWGQDEIGPGATNPSRSQPADDDSASPFGLLDEDETICGDAPERRLSRTSSPPTLLVGCTAHPA